MRQFLFDQSCFAENQGKAAAGSWSVLLHMDRIWILTTLLCVYLKSEIHF